MLPNPQMQPTGRGGPALLVGAALLEARQWKRWFVRHQDDRLQLICMSLDGCTNIPDCVDSCRGFSLHLGPG